MQMFGIDDFKKLKEVSKKTGCRIKLNSRRGLPFFLDRYKKRKIFFALLLLITALVYVESKFVWNIEIEGTENIENAEILEELKNFGLDIGAKKKDINPQDIINQIRLKRDDIAWMRIDLSGTNIVVKLAEKTKKPEIIKEDEYCNIVSKKTGQITKITAKSGTAVAKVGDIVEKRKHLNTVDIWKGNLQEQDMFIGEGEVIAKVWYSKKEKMDLKQVAVSKTGNTQKKYCIKLNNFQINLGKSLPKFQKYDTIVEDKKLKLFSDFYLPITLGISTYYELEEKEEVYTKEEAKEKLKEKLKAELAKEIENKEGITNIQINENEDKTFIEVEVIYEVLESIGTEEKMI